MFPMCGRHENRSREAVLVDLERLAKIVFGKSEIIYRY